MNYNDILQKHIEKIEEIFQVKYDIAQAYIRKYNEYKNRAKRDNISFTINFQQFYLAVTSGCYICDLDGKTNIIGVDRLNPKKGYTRKDKKYSTYTTKVCKLKVCACNKE